MLPNYVNPFVMGSVSIRFGKRVIFVNKDSEYTYYTDAVDRKIQYKIRAGTVPRTIDDVEIVHIGDYHEQEG